MARFGMKTLCLAVVCAALSACGETNNNSELTSAPNISETAGDEAILGLVVGQTINLAAAQACRVAQVDGVQLYSGTLTRANCVAKCGEYEATNPGRSCSHGGSVFRSAPTNICQIVGAAGVVRFSAQSIRKACAQECTKYTNPGSTCLWGGQNVKQ